MRKMRERVGEDEGEGVGKMRSKIRGGLSIIK